MKRLKGKAVVIADGANGIVMNKKQMEENTDEKRAHISPILKTPRFGETYEFAAFATFLISDEAPSVNVQVHLNSGLDGTR